MIHAINARSDGSPFLGDVAQWGDKNLPRFRSFKDNFNTELVKVFS
jgi:hypothetical protein